MRMNDINKTIRKLKESDRYKNFVFFSERMWFDEYFKDKEYDVVQIHDMWVVPNEEGNISGFSGKFSWDGNDVTPLDGDSYRKHMPIRGFEEFKDIENTNCLDILVEPGQW